MCLGLTSLMQFVKNGRCLSHQKMVCVLIGVDDWKVAGRRRDMIIRDLGWLKSILIDSGSCRPRQCSWKIPSLKIVSGMVPLGLMSTIKLSWIPPTKTAWQHCWYSHVIPMTPSHLQLVHFYVLLTHTLRV